MSGLITNQTKGGYEHYVQIFSNFAKSSVLPCLLTFYDIEWFHNAGLNYKPQKLYLRVFLEHYTVAMVYENNNNVPMIGQLFDFMM